MGRPLGSKNKKGPKEQKAFVSFRLPQEVFEELERQVQITGKNRAKLIEEVLTNHLMN